MKESGLKLNSSRSVKKILFVGDTVPKSPLNFGESLKELCKQHEVRVFNLEGTFSEVQKPLFKAGPNLLLNPQFFAPVAECFNIAVLANNHSMDFGLEGFQKTKEICQSHQVATVGAGMNLKEAFAPLDIGNCRIIAVAENEFGAAQANKAGIATVDRPLEIYRCIKEGKESGKFVVVVGHGGTEVIPIPPPYLRDRYKLWVEYGADLIIGNHPHSVQGHEVYNGKYIFYSLGNFAFINDSFKEHPNTNWSIAVSVDLETGNQKVIPLTFDENNCIDVSNNSELEEEYQRLCGLIQSSDYPTIYENIAAELYPLWYPRLRIANKQDAALLLHYLRCDAHKNIVEKALSRIIGELEMNNQNSYASKNSNSNQFVSLVETHKIDLGREDENWFTHTESFERLLSHHVGKPNLLFLELGSWKGRSALWLVENILTGANSKLICVDVWDVNQWEKEAEETISLFKNPQRMEELKVDRLYETFLQNTEDFRDKILPKRQTTIEAFQEFYNQNVKFDFIYIDANHTAEAVYQDFSFAHQCLKPGGIVFFDDTNWKSVQIALKRIVRDFKIKIVNADANGAYYIYSEDLDRKRKKNDIKKTPQLNHPVDYFMASDKVYLASADQFKGIEAIVEAKELLQCRHFYSIVGGLGGLNVLARLKKVESLTFFDVNPHTLEVCEFMFEVIRSAENRNTFVSLIYGREFDSNKYSFDNQTEYYQKPIDSNWTSRLEETVGSKLFSTYKRLYWSYIQNPMEDIYDGASVHCTRMVLFHEAPVNSVMTYPFQERNYMRTKNISCINSFFFGKGWLRDEERYQQVRENLTKCKTSLVVKSIFDLEPPPQSGLYSSNVLDGTELEIPSLKDQFSWILWYSLQSRYLQLEYVKPAERMIPFDRLYGQGVKDTHLSCCHLLDGNFDLNATPFWEVIQPHVTEGMNYGFRFYQGQRPISVEDFIENKYSIEEFREVIGIHILLGGGCPVDTWKRVVSQAVKTGKTVFVFEHRKECTDWPEWDVNPETILPEREIDEFLLSLDSGWYKYGAANIRGDISDVRNICWVLGQEKLLFNLRKTNIILFPDWNKSELDIASELSQVIQKMLKHPDKNEITLLIDTSNTSEENADLILSGAVINLLMEEDLDVNEGPEISLVGELSERQWSNLLARVKYKIYLDNENQEQANMRASKLPVLKLDEEEVKV